MNQPVSRGLHTTVAETLVRVDTDAAFAAVIQLISRLWPERTEVLASRPPAQLVHTVSADPEGDDAVWLTWELTSVASDEWTNVRLVHDEADTNSGPAAELDVVLDLLVEQCGVSSLDRN
ncbi:MAG TPA: hypothetical protein VM121_06620 [Acidimicrobiales bacterium]|nr:hypothetical protein [Acidimicrobiales bacterium]